MHEQQPALFATQAANPLEVFESALLRRSTLGFVDLEVIAKEQGYSHVAGVDEAGRGACCGPITIAACILPDEPVPGLETLNDSKKLSEKQRAQLFPIICEYAVSYAIVHFAAEEIDTLGLQQCNVGGMQQAVAQLDPGADIVFHDFMRGVSFPQPYLGITKGDATVRSIAAASILAKHARDQHMIKLAEQYPGYELQAHKGYGVKKHLDAVRRLGACPEHRYSYANIQRAHEQWLAESNPEPAGVAEYERRRSRKL